MSWVFVVRMRLIWNYVRLADVFGDLVIYRDLNAVDGRLPRYADIWHEIGMNGPIPPRKLDMAYARALERLL